MAKLIDIKGYCNTFGNYEFNEDNMWKGQLLLEEDGWFEGIVNDVVSQCAEDKMIFGIYHPGKIIELFKVSSVNKSDPFIFRETMCAKGNDGQFSTIGIFGEELCGVSHIIMQDVDILNQNDYLKTSQRNIEFEKEDLLKRIQIFKKNNVFEKLYANTLARRKQLSKIVLRDYVYVIFPSAQAEKVMLELQSINDKGEDDSIDGVKKLVK
ncbi:MAG: hypothetical protein ACI33S_06930 [Bacilli bacterium]